MKTKAGGAIAAIIFDRGRLLPFTLILLSVLFPFIVRDDYWTRIGVLVLLYYIVAVGYNALLNHTGQFDSAIAAYFSISAYVSALLDVHTGWSFWVTLPLAASSACVIAVLVGSVTLRFSGDYLAIVTLAFSEINRLIIRNWIGVTRGPLGLPGISDISFLSYEFGLSDYYFFCLLVAVLAALVYRRLAVSRIGLGWASVKENVIASAATGNNVSGYKLTSILFCSCLVGISGAIYPHFINFLDPSVASLDLFFGILIMVILGGGNLIGLFLSVLIFTLIPEVFRGLLVYRMLMLGCVLVALMNIRPEGFQYGQLFYIKIPSLFNRRRDNEIETGFQRAERIGFEPVASIAERPHGEVLLTVEGLSKDFGGLKALSKVGLKVHAAEIVSLIGPNGAGKTTLFNLVTGLSQVTEGSVKFMNTEISDLPPYKICRLGIARTFQNLNLMENLSVYENVMVSRLPRQSSKWNGKEITDQELCLECLNFVGLNGSEGVITKSLPYGDKRRLELARALAAEPKLILVDEPTAGMNQVEVEYFISLLKKIRESGIGVFCIEHNMTVAMGISDRIMVLDYGVKIAEGTAKEISENQRVIEAYLGRQKC